MQILAKESNPKCGEQPDHHGGSVAYFALDAPAWREADEIAGRALARALRILETRGLPAALP